MINEIEKQSILGNLDFIPLIGGVFKWFFKTVGTDLMKRDSIIIFDDFERVSYAETSDNPSDYNDLLGYIDYLSENKRFKIIVILNSKEIELTKENLIDNKFKLNQNPMASTEEVLDNILKKSNLRDDDLGKILSLIFKIYYADIEERVVQDKNNNSKVKKPSLREFQKSLEELSNITDNNEKADYIINWMNSREETESVLMSLVKYFEEKPTEFHMGYLYDILDSELYRYNIDKTILKEKYSNITSKNIIEVINKKKSYFEDLLYYLWKKGSEIEKLRTLGYEFDRNIDFEFEISKEYPYYEELEYDKVKRYFEKKEDREVLESI